MEKWKNITGYENYQVSNYGRIKSLARTITKSIGSHTVKDKLLSTKALSAGYPTVNLCNDGAIDNIRIHRLVAIAFVDNPNPDIYNFVNHKDHDKTNNHYKNLEWTDQAGNMLAAAKMGIGNVGFTIPQITDIKIRLAAGERGCDIADLYGVSRATISEIKTGKNKTAKSIIL
jgi:hypothetical protein